jgi:hypothetical protein
LKPARAFTAGWPAKNQSATRRAIVANNQSARFGKLNFQSLEGLPAAGLLVGGCRQRDYFFHGVSAEIWPTLGSATVPS